MKILYTGSFRFPDKDAASQRVLGIAKALRKMGNEIIFCGWENAPRQQDKASDEFVYQGFKYYSQAELDLPKGNFLRRIFNYLMLGHKTLKWISAYTLTNNITHIIVYNSNSIFILRLKKFCKKNNIELICDCTEWYDGRQLPGGRFGVVNIDNNIRVRFLYPLIKKIIVISSYLKKYLDKKGCLTIIVPPLVDFEESKWYGTMDLTLSKKPGIIRLIYAGDPGKKDLLSPLIEALDQINKEETTIDLSIVGLNNDRFLKDFYSNSSQLPNYINCYGRVSLADVPQYYATSDLSILVRENKRYANAGFPTKFVESLSASVPVIANDTSDIRNYIIHGKNGYILNGIDGYSILRVFEQILSLMQDDFLQMKREAKETALKYFDFKNYSLSLDEFLKKC